MHCDLQRALSDFWGNVSECYSLDIKCLSKGSWVGSPDGDTVLGSRNLRDGAQLHEASFWGRLFGAIVSLACVTVSVCLPSPLLALSSLPLLSHSSPHALLDVLAQHCILGQGTVGRAL